MIGDGYLRKALSIFIHIVYPKKGQIRFYTCIDIIGIMGLLEYAILGIVFIILILIGLMLWRVFMGKQISILNLYFIIDDTELAYFRHHVESRLREHNNVRWYLVKYDELTKSCIEIETNAQPVAVIESPTRYISDVVRMNRDVDAIVYSGHSSGPFLGREEHPMINIGDFVRILRAELRKELAFIWFDSCNMGYLQSLVMMAGIAKYVVGAPNYYDWQSVLQTSEIYHLSRGDDSELRDVMMQQAGKFDGVKDVLVELCVYEPRRLNTLWLLYKQYCGKLQYPDNAKIEDDYYDITRLVEANSRILGPDIVRDFEDALNAGVLRRARCKSCAVDVPESYLAVQKNKDICLK